MKRTAGGTGARGGRPAIFQGVSVISRDDDADDRAPSTRDRPPGQHENALNYLGRYFEHYDFSRHPLDAPSRTSAIWGKTASAALPTPSSATPANVTPRCARVAPEAASPRPVFSGTPEAVADGLQRWFDVKPPTVSSSAAVRLTPRPLRRSGGTHPATAWPVPSGVPRRYAARAPGPEAPVEQDSPNNKIVFRDIRYAENCYRRPSWRP